MERCRSGHPGRHIIKFADDTAIVSLLKQDEIGQGPVLNDFVSRCEASHLQLNASKNKELVFGFRREAHSLTLSIIKGEKTEVTKYRYLGLIIDHKLPWDQCADAVFKKGQQRMYFLKKLNLMLTTKFRFYFISPLLRTFFHTSVYAGMITPK